MIKKIEIASIGDELRIALKSEPVHSKEFTARVQSLAREIGSVLSAEVEHDDNMNYSSAQKITLWLNGDGQAVPIRDPHATYRLNAYISSRGSYFTFVTLKLSASTSGGKEVGLKNPGCYWAPVSNEDLPKHGLSYLTKIAAVMQSKEYMLLDGPVLWEHVDGRQTELEGKPATVFEVLFSEEI